MYRFRTPLYFVGVFVVALFAALLPMVAFAQDAVTDNTNKIDGLSDTQIWGIISGAIISYASAWINRSHWPSDRRFFTFFVLGLIMTFITTVITTTVTLQHLGHTILYVVGGGVVWYSVNRGAVKAFEQRTE